MLTLPHTTGWRVIEDTTIALLDQRVAQRLARYPELIDRFVGRAVERSRNLAINMAIIHQPRIEVRLLMLFWHLAARWGHVRPDGVAVPLRLSHSVLADIVASRRPTVTTALSDLAQRGELRLDDSVWILTGQPPGALLELGARPPGHSGSPAEVTDGHPRSADIGNRGNSSIGDSPTGSAN